LSKLNNVIYLQPKDIDWSNLSTKKFHEINSDSYRNGLDAEYFENLGTRVLDEAQLDSRVLRKAKDVFNEVSAITQSVIQQKKITKVIVPGGRTLIPSAILSSSQNLEVDNTILESAPAGDFGYSEYPSNFRSHFGLIQLEIDRRWREGDNSKYEIAELYLRNKLESTFSKTFDFNLDTDDLFKTNTVVVFLTSGFEFNSFGTTKNGEYGRSHQRQMVQFLCQAAKENNFKVILRAHPPILGHEELSVMDDEEWAPFCIENEIMYLASDSRINSYELMKRSNLNAVYVSTAGVDSLILGCETLILGNAEYAHLVPELCAFDFDAIRSRFHALNHRTEIRRIYPYAFYSSTLGQEISHASLSDGGGIFLKGKQVDAPRFKLLFRVLKRL
jgi:hypothetical protein